jgi:hypothetical protein
VQSGSRSFAKRQLVRLSRVCAGVAVIGPRCSRGCGRARVPLSEVTPLADTSDFSQCLATDGVAGRMGLNDSGSAVEVTAPASTCEGAEAGVSQHQEGSSDLDLEEHQRRFALGSILTVCSE